MGNLRVADGDGETGVDGAAVSGVVIGGLEVGLLAGIIVGLAAGSRAGLVVAAVVGGLDGEAVLLEDGVGVHVDAGQVPEDGVAGLGVLELQHIRLVLVRGQLDGDTAAVGVGAVLLGEGAAVGGDGLHGTGLVGDGPGVDVLVQSVGDQDLAAGGGGVAADDGRGQSRGQRSEGGSKANSLGEHHFEM